MTLFALFLVLEYAVYEILIITLTKIIMFKINWEKVSITHTVPREIIYQMVKLACPGNNLISYEVVAGGCANLNIKLYFQENQKPAILRIYIRDRDAADREQKLALLLKKSIPVPILHYVGEVEGYRFAIVEFIPGISLRDLLLGDRPYDMNTVMREVGETLARILSFKFPGSGFFDKNLQVIPYHGVEKNLLIYAQECLKNQNINTILGAITISRIRDCFNKYGYLLNSEESSLVHGDFDPANILVTQDDNGWKVSGVLDWEFAFSGAFLWDVANMLRYAHKMPSGFQDAFMSSLSHRVQLPTDWRVITHLLNLLSLLDCLKRSDINSKPEQCADICELVNHILYELAGG